MTERLVGVHLREERYIVTVYSKTPMGVWLAEGIPVLLPEDSTTDQLGTAVRHALGQSRVGVGEVTRDSQPDRALLDLLQLPDYATYVKGTLAVEVYSDGDTIEVTPERNEGPRTGFVTIEEETQTLPDESPEQLGAVVKEAFTKAV